jgi:hypothetical protein
VPDHIQKPQDLTLGARAVGRASRRLSGRRNAHEHHQQCHTTLKDLPHTNYIGASPPREDPSFPHNGILDFEDAAGNRW